MTEEEIADYEKSGIKILSQTIWAKKGIEPKQACCS